MEPDRPEPSSPFADDVIARAPLPTARTLRLRVSLPFQLWRFVVINVRMGWLAFRGHH